MQKLSVTTEYAEVYEHRIFALADEYMETVLQNDDSKISDTFMGMIYYIRDGIPEIPNDDIQLMDSVFDIFCKLCARLGTVPTLQTFAILVRTNRATFTDWSNREYRKDDARYEQAVKRWKSVCKAFLVNKLANCDKTSVNLIFLAKSCYGMVEAGTPITQTIPEKPILSADQLPDLSKGV